MQVEDFRVPGILQLPERQVDKVVTFVNLMVALFFLVLAVWLLWLTEDLSDLFPVRLAVLTAFVLLFSLYIGYYTSAKRAEVFGAAAAYAAVLVVFLGS